MHVSGRSTGFVARQEQHLARTGRANAVGTSRCKAALLLDEEGPTDDAASTYSRFSHAPSLHPSMAGSVVSEACHSETIGAGDETAYWDYSHRTVERHDLGHNCRECRRPFTKIGEPLTERRGARLSMRYHAQCFSGYADPRSQLTSSHHSGKLAGTQLEAAPGSKAGGKMRTSQHFEGGGAARSCQGGGGTGKSGMGLGMGSNGFGAKSSRGCGVSTEASDNQAGVDLTPPAPSAGPGLSEAALRAHQERQRLEEQQHEGDACAGAVSAAQRGLANLACGSIAEGHEAPT